MEGHAPTLEEPPWRWAHPEPHMPPGLNREQAWAWALDNFPALSRPSCQCPQFCEDPLYCACGRLQHACARHTDHPPVEVCPKRCRDPRVREPVATPNPGWSSSPLKKRPKPQTSRHCWA